MKRLWRNDDCPKDKEIRPGCKICQKCKFFYKQYQDAIACTFCDKLEAILPEIAQEVMRYLDENYAFVNRNGSFIMKSNKVELEDLEEFLRKYFM